MLSCSDREPPKNSTNYLNCHPPLHDTFSFGHSKAPSKLRRVASKCIFKVQRNVVESENFTLLQGLRGLYYQQPFKSTTHRTKRFVQRKLLKVAWGDTSQTYPTVLCQSPQHQPNRCFDVFDWDSASQLWQTVDAAARAAVVGHPNRAVPYDALKCSTEYWKSQNLLQNHIKALTGTPTNTQKKVVWKRSGYQEDLFSWCKGEAMDLCKEQV